MIKIPFTEEMAFRIIAGRKHCTSRSRQMGEVGDAFEVTWGGTTAVYVLRHIESRSLGFVAQYLHDPEGFDSVREFIDYWVMLHKRDGFHPGKFVSVHWFTFVEYLRGDEQRTPFT
jgi:hypothetical protein